MHQSFLLALLILTVILLIYYDCNRGGLMRTGMTNKERWANFKHVVGREAADKVPVCNTIDGHCYPVVKDFKNTDEASKRLAALNKFCVRVLRYLRHKYIFNAEKTHDMQKKIFVQRMIRNFNPDNFVENNPPNHINTSYVDDKGKVFAMCLREKQTGEGNFHSMHELEFVALHEMTHLGTQSFDHDAEFWHNFRFLLQETKDANLHIPVDYKTKPINYCGLHVNYNPYFDG